MLYEYQDEDSDLVVRIRSMHLADKDKDHLLVEVTFDSHQATLINRPFHLWFREKLIGLSKIHLTNSEGEEIPKAIFQEVAYGIQDVMNQQWEELGEESDSEMLLWRYRGTK